jgi:hypothetical protein
MTEYERLIAMVKRDFDNDKHVTFDQCLEWDGYHDRYGYPSIGIKNKPLKGHRLVYEYFVGPIEPGMQVLHTCDNPRCINPFHLWQRTILDNVRDSVEKGRAACLRTGEDHFGARLSNLDVEFIRKSSFSQKYLAERFGCSPDTIKSIRNYNSRKTG